MMQEKLFPFYEGSILDNYIVKIYARAYRDLDGIYTYIAENPMEPGTALNMIDKLEKAIFSLDQFPERGAIRHTGAYAGGNYHQYLRRITLSSTVCIKTKRNPANHWYC